MRVYAMDTLMSDSSYSWTRNSSDGRITDRVASSHHMHYSRVKENNKKINAISRGDIN